MSTTAKASDHVKPCNIEQSERHNRRDAEYIASLNPRILYVRADLSPNNESYVVPDLKGPLDHRSSTSLSPERGRTKKVGKASWGRLPCIFTSFKILQACLFIRACLTLCNPMDYSPPGSSVHLLHWRADSLPLSHLNAF